MAKYKHRVLIVDDEKKISSALGRILKKNGIEFVSCKSGEAGLKELKKPDTLFSLIISDQLMPGMTGTEFFTEAKKMSPATVRILISAYSDNDVLIDAINRGIIQKFIPKPWEIDDLITTVKQGFLRFKNAFENEKLVRMAKKQNKKLYQLDKNLKKRLEDHKQKIIELDKSIEKMKDGISKMPKPGMSKKPALDVYFETLLKKNNMLENNTLNSLFCSTLYELHGQFKSATEKKGFELPELD